MYARIDYVLRRVNNLRQSSRKLGSTELGPTRYSLAVWIRSSELRKSVQSDMNTTTKKLKSRVSPLERKNLDTVGLL